MTSLRRLLRCVAVTGVAGALLALPVAASATQQSQLSDQDRQFIIAMAQGNRMEALTSRLAQQRTTDRRVLDLAAMFTIDHTAAQAQLRAVATRHGVALPTAPSPDQQRLAAQLPTGSAFPTAWLQLQLAGHGQAIAAGATEISQGSASDVIAYARATAPMISKHYAAIRQALGGRTPTGVAAGSAGLAATHPGGTGDASGSVLIAVGVAAMAVGLIGLTLRHTTAATASSDSVSHTIG